ncbi:Solitary outer membrane autotransporter beta-barrel domain [Vibrio sp. ABG19]|nr:Solitary outer membrane autotransporter beta-barrel domain [Vibrio sp. ABG19]WGY44983.1 Solitary outer membrane autotransporter beta-barrel domain [Vibrio sp. ABG19]
MSEPRVVALRYLLYGTFFTNVVTAYAGYPELEKFLENNFAASIVLSDSDVFSVGISDFNPNEILNTENENWGTEGSLDNRKTYAIAALPYRIELSDEDAVDQHSVMLRLSGMISDETLRFNQDEPADDFHQTVIDFYAAYRIKHRFDQHWSLEPGLGHHLMHYENHVDYHSPTGRMLQPYLDDLLFNTSAWASVLEPQVRVKYESRQSWGHWYISSAWHYFYGFGWGQANQGDVGNPEGWYGANSITGVYDFSQLGPSVQSVYASLRRVDVGGDIRHPLGTPVYYETTFGWLMTPPFDTDWIDNVGVGLSLNYGSAFKGGSIVLFFNQE